MRKMFGFLNSKKFLKARTWGNLGLLIFLFTVASAQAQVKTATIKGVIKNETGELLSGASILVQGSKVYTTSRKDGSFEVNEVP